MTIHFCEKTEHSFLSALISDPNSIAEAVSLVPHKGFFYMPFNGDLYESIQLLFMEGDSIDTTTLYTHMSELTDRPDIAGRISTIANHHGHSSMLGQYSKTLHDRYIRRKAVENAATIMKMVDHDDDATEILDRFQEAYLQMTQEQTREMVIDIDKLADSSATLMLELSATDNTIVGMSSGFSELDHKLGGLKPEQLIILASRPSVGKSAICLNMLYDMCFKQKKKAMLFSLEMSAKQIMTRVYAMATEIDHYTLRTGQAMKSPNLRQKVEEFASECKTTNNLSIYDGAIVSLQDIRSEAIKMKELKGLDIIVIDYLQLMHTPKAERREQEIAKLTRGLKILARELEMPIMVLSQLSRMSEQTNARPQLHNLRESGAIEQDADIVLFLHRTNEDGVMGADKNIELITAKNRDGACGIDELLFKDTICKFSQRTGNHYV